jgi:NAD(P)H dehydrogenase (quinone)
MEPPPICLPYHSGNGHTRRLVDGIAAGMTVARIIDVAAMQPADWAALDAAPAIVFACPTYMGCTSAAYGGFLEQAADRWPGQRWADKLAAGATVASYPSGDKLMTLTRLAVYAAQQGMLWIGQAEIGAPVDTARPGINRDGSHLGLMATASRDKTRLIDDHDLETARLFGVRIAAAARRWG